MKRKKFLKKARNDAIAQKALYRLDSTSYIIDSIGHANTINKLEDQRFRDSTKLIEDSSRFQYTILKFGEQLVKQNIALDNIQELQHPISPLKVHVNLTVKLDKLPPPAIKFLKDYKEKISSSYVDYPTNFYNFTNSDNTGSIEYYDFNPADKTKKYDTLISNFNRLMYDYILPKVWFYFYTTDTVSSINDNSAGMFLIANGITDGGTTFNKDFRLTYKYYIFKNEVNFDFTFNDPIINEKKKTINSLYSIRNGLIAIRLVSYSHEAEMILNAIEFRSGNNYYDRYPIYFDKKDILSYKTDYNILADFYIKRGKDIIR